MRGLHALNEGFGSRLRARLLLENIAQILCAMKQAAESEFIGLDPIKYQVISELRQNQETSYSVAVRPDRANLGKAAQ